MFSIFDFPNAWRRAHRALLGGIPPLRAIYISERNHPSTWIFASYLRETASSMLHIWAVGLTSPWPIAFWLFDFLIFLFLIFANAWYRERLPLLGGTPPNARYILAAASALVQGASQAIWGQLPCSMLHLRVVGLTSTWPIAFWLFDFLIFLFFDFSSNAWRREHRTLLGGIPPLRAIY